MFRRLDLKAQCLDSTSVASYSAHVVSELLFGAQLVEHLLVEDCFEDLKTTLLVEPSIFRLVFDLKVDLDAAVIFFIIAVL